MALTWRVCAALTWRVVRAQAVCNDGSSAFYYFSAASQPQLATVWVVYLEGGEWCVARVLRARPAPRSRRRLLQ